MLYVGADSVSVPCGGGAFAVAVVPAAVEDAWDVAEPSREDGWEANGLAAGAEVVVDGFVAAVVSFLRADRDGPGSVDDREGDKCDCVGYEGTFRASIVAVIVIDS